ncbi:MAG TPA: hypothetical protein VFF73_41095 [Planctomycetota bacterium]|nr:hypothetical protein [Planctomycetota bacterium]
MESKQGTHPEILARVDALAMKGGDKAVERAARLPQAFLSKARKGLCGGAKAAASWGKLLAWLERQSESGERPATTAPASDPAPGAVPDELAAAIDRAKTFPAIGECLTRITAAVKRGELDRFVGKALVDCLKERRMTLSAEEEAAAFARAGEEEVVRVVLIRDWDGSGQVPVLPPLKREIPEAERCLACAGTGRRPVAAPASPNQERPA